MGLTPLKRMRHERGIKQWRLAQMVGVDQSTLSKYEQGYKRPNAWVRHKISEILKADVDALFPEQQDA